MGERSIALAKNLSIGERENWASGEQIALYLSFAATQAGADVMKRIATPMIGGVITSAILELLIYPVIYVHWRKRELSPND